VGFAEVPSLMKNTQIITSTWCKEDYMQLLLVLRGYLTWWKTFYKLYLLCVKKPLCGFRGGILLDEKYTNYNLDLVKRSLYVTFMGIEGVVYLTWCGLCMKRTALVGFTKVSSLMKNTQIITSTWYKEDYMQLLWVLRGYLTWCKIFFISFM